MAKLELKDVRKSYGPVEVIKGIDLTIEDGEFCVFVGPSGCGKSTLLRMIAGLEDISGGIFEIDGNRMNDIAPAKRGIAMVFQSYALYPHLSVRENIAFGLKQDKLPKADIDARVAQMLKLVHMERFAKRKPHQLSGGQRQRVALARSLAKRPKLLLLDEPMGALDKKLRTEMQLEVVEIIEQVGVTCIMVTHDQEEAMTMADRVAIMADGWIEQIGSPIDIYTTQASNRRVWVALRPEKIWLTREKPTTEYNWAAGKVDDIAYLGGFSLYYVRTQSGQIIKVSMANTERRGDRPTWEDSVYVYWEDHSTIVLNR